MLDFNMANGSPDAMDPSPLNAPLKGRGDTHI